MAIEQLDKLLVPPDPVGDDPVAPARLPQTFAHEQSKHGRTTPGSSVKKWLRIRAVLNVCTGRRARRVLRRVIGLLVVGGVAYLVFLALVDDFRPIERTRIIPANQRPATISLDQQQTIAPSDQQQAITPTDQQQAIVPSDEQRVTISGGSVHEASAEDRSSYSLATAPPVANEPPENSPFVSPDRNTAVSANDGRYVVQISAERSDAKAQASFKTLQSRYPHVLGDRSALIRRVELSKKGVFYRAQIGPFDTVEQAKQLCARLKSAGGHCMVQKNS
jgi:cell division septation protein DedD